MESSDFSGSCVIGDGLFGLSDADQPPARATAEPEISRFPCKELADMRGVLDPAGPTDRSRKRGRRVVFPM
jgi:hypothetical protein